MHRREAPLKVRVLLFASYRERAGASELWLELPAGSKVADARRALLRRVPGLAHRAEDIVVAVNAEYASPDQTLKDGDELALIPPVSGGAWRSLHSSISTATNERPYDAAPERQA